MTVTPPHSAYKQQLSKQHIFSMLVHMASCGKYRGLIVLSCIPQKQHTNNTHRRGMTGLVKENTPVKCIQLLFMNPMKTCPSVTFYFMKNSFLPWAFCPKGLAEVV